MNWCRNEIERLSPILEQISSDLAPVDGKHILVLCSATGEVAFWLGEMMEQGKVAGLELDPESLEVSRRAAHEMGLEGVVEFFPGEKKHIPLPDASIDALVSEFIVYPTSTPTEISQVEMARVLQPGGKIILTDVIVTQPLDQPVRDALQSIGLDYWCEATQADFRSWMADAGLVNLQLLDLTPTLRHVWEYRRSSDRVSAHQAGYACLLDDPDIGLGRAIFYIYLNAEKPTREG
jgi:ubiquinone/menaquinone biosynthesis C-methylase UbiE